MPGRGGLPLSLQNVSTFGGCSLTHRKNHGDRQVLAPFAVGQAACVRSDGEQRVGSSAASDSVGWTVTATCTSATTTRRGRPHAVKSIRSSGGDGEPGDLGAEPDAAAGGAGRPVSAVVLWSTGETGGPSYAIDVGRQNMTSAVSSFKSHVENGSTDGARPLRLRHQRRRCVNRRRPWPRQASPPAGLHESSESAVGDQTDCCFVPPAR